MSLARNPIARDLDWTFLTFFKDAVFQIEDADTKVSNDTMWIVKRGVCLNFGCDPANPPFTLRPR
jgi:hypothetical protein